MFMLDLRASGYLLKHAFDFELVVEVVVNEHSSDDGGSFEVVIQIYEFMLYLFI